jgi:outer membrane protein TolC
MRPIIPCCVFFLSVAMAVNAQNSTNAPVRQLSLAECIRSALERNLSLQVGDRVALGETADLDVRSGGRLGLEEARIAVHQSYSYYDPEFFTRVGQNFNAIPPSFTDVAGAPPPSREVWRETFSTGLGGQLPTGGRLDLTATGQRISGKQFNGIDFDNLPFEYSGDTAITLTQPLLKDFWIDAGRLNIKLSKQNLKMSEFSFRLLVMDIVKRVAVAYFDVVAARDQIKVQQKALELAQQLVAENKKKVEVGTMAPLDEKQAESQAAKAKSDLTASIFGSQQAENALKSLITHDFAEVQPAVIQPTDRLLPLYQSFSLPECWRNGLEQRPDYLLSKQQVEARDIVLVYRRNQLFPALDVAATYGRNAFGPSSSEAVESVDDNRYAKYGGAVLLRFPLTFRAERDSYKLAKIARQSAVLTLKRKEDSVLQEIDVALKLVQSSYDATESTRAARSYAEAALDAENKKLENGKSTSFNVLQLQKDLTTAASDEIKALSIYNKALHELYFSEGTTLERNKVALELK